jgi:hypothetical protein
VRRFVPAQAPFFDNPTRHKAASRRPGLLKVAVRDFVVNTSVSGGETC